MVKDMELDTQTAGILVGLCHGILTDREVHESELSLLYQWLLDHPQLLQQSSCKQLMTTLSSALEEGLHRDLLLSINASLQEAIDHFSPHTLPESIFIGLCFIAAADQKIDATEVKKLQQWVNSHPRIKNMPAIYQLYQVIESASINATNHLEQAKRAIDHFLALHNLTTVESATSIA